MLQLIFIVYILLVITISLIPTAIGGSGLYSDKLAHFLAYGGMGFLAYMSVDSVKKRFYLFLLIISLGVVLEFFQFFIPGRSASFLDVIANTIGVVSGYFAGWLVLATDLRKLVLDEEIVSREPRTDYRDSLKNVP